MTEWKKNSHYSQLTNLFSISRLFSFFFPIQNGKFSHSDSSFGLVRCIDRAFLSSWECVERMAITDWIEAIHRTNWTPKRHQMERSIANLTPDTSRSNGQKKATWWIFSNASRMVCLLNTLPQYWTAWSNMVLWRLFVTHLNIHFSTIPASPIDYKMVDPSNRVSTD